MTRISIPRVHAVVTSPSVTVAGSAGGGGGGATGGGGGGGGGGAYALTNAGAKSPCEDFAEPRDLSRSPALVGAKQVINECAQQVRN